MRTSTAVSTPNTSTVTSWASLSPESLWVTTSFTEIFNNPPPGSFSLWLATRRPVCVTTVLIGSGCVTPGISLVVLFKPPAFSWFAGW